MTSNAELADRLEKALRERPGVRAVEELVRTNSAAILTALRSEPAAGDVERVARAIYIERWHDPDATRYEQVLTEDQREGWRRLARAALAAMAGETGGE